MKNILLVLIIAMVAAVGTTVAAADPNFGKNQTRPPLGNNPHPVIWGGQTSKPASPAPQPSARTSADHDGSRHGGGRSYYYFGGNYPYAGGTYAYDSYYGYGCTDPYAYPPFYYTYPPPLYLPAEELFGPRAVRRFMGVDDRLQPQPSVKINAPAAPENAKADAPEPKKPSERATNPKAIALAWRFIGFGDAQFAEQKYGEANGRYRKASQSAPQLADAWFRQGLALSAIARYDLAVGAIKRGLKITPNWPQSDFDLKELYGVDELAKDAHLDALAAAAEERPNDANLLFLVGVHLHFDGQAQRAEKFFQRAKELAGDDVEHIRPFLIK